MPPKIARVGDSFSGHCQVHGNITGTITTGSTLTKDEAKDIARVGDVVTGSCGHKGVIKTGSSLWIDETKAVARVGDTVGIGNPGDRIDSGTITSGSNLTNSD
jgi:uncharacterized Zn-binding protein involved in type VI secretion